MEKQKILDHISKTKWKDHDWILDREIQPSNRVICIVLTSDLRFKIDFQWFGEWQNDNIIAWAYPDDIIQPEAPEFTGPQTGSFTITTEECRTH